MLTRNRIARAASLVVLVAALGVSTVAPAYADGRANTGLASVGRNQSARLNATHTGDATSHALRVRLEIVAADGTVVAERDTMLRPGQSASLELPAGTGATQLRGGIRVSSGDVSGAGEASEDELMGTFEITNPETGATALLLPAVQKVRQAAARMR